LLAVLVVLVAGCSPTGRDQLLSGERLIRAGRPNEAIEPLRAAVEAFSTNATAAAQAWNYLGLAYHHSGRHAEAAQAYKTALDKDFNLYAARYNRGALFLDQGSVPAAINELTTFTTHQPKDPAGWLLLGKAQLRAGMYDAADRNLQQALRLNPSPADQAEALNALGMGQAQRRRAREAFQYFEAALNRVTNYPPALLNQALLSQQLNDRAFALQKYAAYLAVASNAPNAQALRTLTNQLALALQAAAPAAPAASPASPATNLLLAVRTSAPPALVRTSVPPAPPATSPPPAVVRTSAPPTILQTSPPPAVARTQAPAAGGRTNPPTAAPAATNLAQASRPAEPDSPRPALPVARPETNAPLPSPVLVAESGTTAPIAPPTVAAPPTATEGDTNVAAAPVPPPSAPAQPEPPLEPVKVEPEPEIKPAAELALASPVTAPAPTESAATNLPAAARPLLAPPPEPEAARKRSLVSRLNPLGWFGGGEEDPEKVREREAKKLAEQERKAQKEAEKQAEREAKKRVTPVEKKPAPAPAPAPPAAPPAPAFARYVYRNPPVPAAGNRAEADRLVAEGVTAHRAGRLGDALAAYTRAIQADPTSFNAQFNLGVAGFDNRDWPKALAAYELALALAPADGRARYGFALTLERAGYPLDAAAELGKLVASQPANVEAHFALANLSAGPLANTPQAREHYLKVLQLQPNHPQAGMIKRWLGPAYRP
jgi:tetratricopeptide (TPR) repeat protein